MKVHSGLFPPQVKDSSVTTGILGNACCFMEGLFVGREKGLTGFDTLVGGCYERQGEVAEMGGGQVLQTWWDSWEFALPVFMECREALCRSKWEGC